ncbi:MAG: thiamine pyrophosphate-dependent dehydrogenase E1 component subunit alpha, partial [Aldersonia sp.]|nr:thiamine pyrophosphate-dependent dehydrogenase E1 component subunit alpha [Aldersonia sp.]
DDYYITTYRCLADVVAKGVPLPEVFAELLGRATGTSRGKGGTMHITDAEHGLMLTTGIVGSGTPIANGLGLSAQLRGEDRVTGVSFGDGATSSGALHEALNLASLWELPVIFVCHNNLWGEFTSVHASTKTQRLAQRAAPFKIPGVTVDGTDLFEVHAAAVTAVERARQGGGPTFLEVVAPRILGHSFGDTGEYMDQAAVEEARANDPIRKLGRWLVDHGHVGSDDLDAMAEQVAGEVEQALAFALHSEMLPPDELRTDVFAPGVDTPR